MIAAGGDPAQGRCSPASARPHAEMRRGARRRHPVLQRRVRGRARRAWPPSRARRGRVAPVSFRVNPDVDPKTHPYISTGLKESKFGVAFDDALALYRRAAALPGDRRPRHRHPHRLADHRPRAVPGGRRARCSSSSTGSPADGHPRSSTSTSAAASASATATRRRCRLAEYRARCCARLFAGRRERLAARAGPPARRRRRRAAHARRVPEAGAGEALRDRRRGDERPDASGALRRLASRSTRCVRAAADRRALGGRRPDLRERRFPRARPRARRSPRAICSRSAPPARTRWR